MSDQLKFPDDFICKQDDKNTSPVTEKCTITPQKNVASFVDLKTIL